MLPDSIRRPDQLEGKWCFFSGIHPEGFIIRPIGFLIVVIRAGAPRVVFIFGKLLAFGIGDTSKVVTSWIVVVFLVFFNTFEGARSIDEGFVNAARLLGASEWQITRTVVIPSTMAWVFASLSPAISFALIGVIVGEFIGAEREIPPPDYRDQRPAARRRG